MPRGYDFLSHRFRPLAGTDNLPYSRREEAKLLNSYSNLAALYGYTPLNVKGTLFPFNIRKLHQQASEQLAPYKNMELLLLEQDGEVRLATARVASTGTTLFYLQARPLWKLMQDRRRSKETNLLLSVFAYLHQIAGIPFFNAWSYIGSQYERLKEWLYEDDTWTDSDDYAASLSQVEMAVYFGERIHRQVRHTWHIKTWQDRLQWFRPKDETAAAISEIAGRFFHLYETFPHRSITDNIHETLLQPQEQEMRMCMEQIFSFIWDEHGWLGEQLFEMVSMELNECCAADEPVSLQYFDREQKEREQELDFEFRLYDLLHELSDVLRII